ncbi:MAG: hypothetical protein COA94_02315 [Rickettsiales bacterium]|nr:MAG: hypothetical protein COA94_02315 [Rickettsiales bacterium]
MTPGNVSNLESDGWSSFQKRLHTIESKGETIPSKFSHQATKISWSTPVVREVASRNTRSGSTYEADMNCDFLSNSYMTLDLPQITVGDEYLESVQVCWTPNIFHNIIESGGLYMNGYKYQNVDKYWLDIHSQLITTSSESKRNAYMKNIGNKAALCDWSCNIEGDELFLFIPWFFTENSVLSLPLLLIKDSVKFEFKFNLNFSSLIRMRIKGENGNWECIKYDSKYLKGINDKQRIPSPQMFAKYLMILESERKWRLSESSHKIYARDMVRVSSMVVREGGDRVDININCSNPITHIYWTAENMEQNKLNNLSNYTTSGDESGKNPIHKRSMSYGPLERDEELSGGHFEYADPYMSLAQLPKSSGYNSSSYSDTTKSINADTGISTSGKNSTMALWIKSETDQQKYRVNCYLEHMIEITYSKKDKCSISSSQVRAYK